MTVSHDSQHDCQWQSKTESVEGCLYCLARCCPSVSKHAVMKPLVKKSTLHNNRKNYCPVSSLAFIVAKVFGNIVLRHLLACFNSHDLLCHSQSAYCPCHSTETALLKVTNDILLDVDSVCLSDVSVLTLLHLSFAFDTVVHHTVIIFSSTDVNLSMAFLAPFFCGWVLSYTRLTSCGTTLIMDLLKRQPCGSKTHIIYIEMSQLNQFDIHTKINNCTY